MKDTSKIVIRPEVFKKPKAKTVHFKSGGGVEIVNDETRWPHMLVVEMDRTDAMGVISGLATQLADISKGSLYYSFLGELRED